MTRRSALLPLLAGLLALDLLAPFAAGLAHLGDADWAGADLAGLLRASRISVASASCATLLVALGGVPLGFLLARAGSRRMALLGFLVQLPLALPPLASGILLLFLVGYASPLGRLTGGALTDSFAGIVLAEAFVAAPFLIIAARSAFAGVDPALEDVAATLGHGPGAVFRRISLALSWRAILAGMLLTWLRAFGEFGATVMVAYHPYSLPTYTYVAFGSQGLPAMLPVLAPTLAIAVAVMAVSRISVPSARAPEAASAPAASAPADPPPPIAAAAPGAPDRPAPGLVLSARRQLPGFTLDVSWRTQARRLAILGPSGSGKSLTLRLIAGLDVAPGAVLRLGEADLAALPPEARGVAYVPQGYALPPHLPLARQVRFAADADPALARHWTERLGLAGLETRRPAELSLGQQQRVALARALARRGTRLLLLDEPFAALDVPLRARLRADMLALQREIAATSILVTHDPEEAMQLADELLLLQAGRVLQAGPVAAVFARPASAAAMRLLGGAAMGQGRVTREGAIDIGGGVHLRVAGPPLAEGSLVGWCARPHQVRIGTAGAYPARVLRRGELRGGARKVLLALGDGSFDVSSDPGCPVPGPCRADIDPAALQVWPAHASFDTEADAPAIRPRV